MSAIGLSSADAAARLAEVGPNRLVTAPRWRRIRQAISLIADPLAVMLVIAGVVDLLLGERADAIILFVALVPVLGVDVVLEARSERALARLRAAVAPTARALRDGVERAIPTEDIVPGDVVVVREGDLVFADARVLEGGAVTVDEAHLTGEAEPQPRRAGDPLHAGSRVLAGRAEAEVTTTGRATAYGTVATLVAEATSGETPLQHRIRAMVARLYTLALVVAAGLFVFDLARGISPGVAVIAAISLAMAAAPEEFPVVFTVFLSLGAARLAKRGLLVRRLVSVEALGSTTTVCVDKTGTLTHGRFVLDEHRALATGEEELLATAALACEPVLEDAMDIAIGQHCKEHGFDVAALHARGRLAADHELEAAGRHMTHVWQFGPRWTAALKGALEGVLEHCTLAAAARAAAVSQAEELAARGMRVLAVARRSGEGPAPLDRADAEQGAELVGLLGFRDPIRTEARDAVAACRQAGISLKIVTGDHALTARAVAEAVGIPVEDHRVVTGLELEKLDADARSERIRHATVLARIRPEQKYEIVETLVGAGEVVAMAGDGINDAPALRRASIGVSMGAHATEVAREAAALVLLRDDLGAMVDSVREGRHIYRNLQTAFLFLVAFHIPLIGLALTAPLIGVPILLPIHLVWLELVIHPIAALAFEAEPAPPDLMTRPPRPPNQPMLPRPLLVRSIIVGVLLAAFAFATFVALRDGGEAIARTYALVVVIVGGLVIAWFSRAVEGPWWRAGVPRNARFWIVAVVVLATLALVLAIPTLARLLHVVPFGALG